MGNKIQGEEMTSADFKYLVASKRLYDAREDKSIGIRLTEIANAVKVSKASVFRAIDRLEKSGYIRKNDRNKIVITEYGFAQLAEYRIMIEWLCSHLQYHCNISEEIARVDAINAACAMSDESRHGLAEFIKSGTADRRKDER